MRFRIKIEYQPRLCKRSIESGSSVASAGDVNGDGYADIIIGAPDAYTGGTDSGTSYIIFGKATGFSNIYLSSLTNQGFAVYGAAAEDRSGCSVASAGDVNGDGYDDIIIGAEEASTVGDFSGTSYVIFGKALGFSDIYLSSLTSAQGFAVYGTANEYSGHSVASAGDVNGDGYDDIIIGAFWAKTGGDHSGTSYVIFGKALGFSDIYLSSLTSAQGFAVYGAAAEDRSGCSVASAGDVNGDSYDDIIIGAYLANTGGTDSGTSYIIFGKATGFSNIYLSSLTIDQGFAVYGASAKDQSGFSVASAGDVNGDGYADIIIGAPYAYTGGTNSGTSYIIFGKATGFSNIYLSSLTKAQGFAVYGAAASEYSGSSVASAGDVNKDGYDEIIIGAYSADTGEGNSGTSYVIFGKNSGFSNIYLFSLISSQGFAVYGAANGDFSGRSVASAGDINDDGFADIIIGATGADTAGSDSGASYVIFGNVFTDAPTFVPTANPTMKPTLLPTLNPTHEPTSPSFEPTFSPSASPTEHSEIKENLWNVISSSDAFMPGILSAVGGILVFSAKVFSKMICFNILKDSNDSGARQKFSYKICGKIYGVAYAQSKQAELLIKHDTGESSISSDTTQSNNAILDSNILGKINAPKANDMRESDVELCRASNDRTTTPSLDNAVEIRAIHTIKYNNPLLNHPQLLEIFKEIKQLGALNALMDGYSADSQAYNAFAKSIETIGVKDAVAEFHAKIAAGIQGNAITLYQEPIPTDNMQSSSTNNQMISLLSARQIIEYLPLMKHATQASINYLGYNITLPEALDNKAILATTHLVLGNAAAQYLPAEMVMNGMVISTISSGSYGVRLVAADYLREQQHADGPVDLAKTCGITMLAYTLPGAINCAMTKVMLPEAACAITGYDALASGSLGAIQCYSSYKATVQYVEPSTADVVVPYIADAAMLFALGRNLQLDASNPAILMLSIKSSLSVAATVYATDCVARMVMDVVPNGVKEDYIDPAFDYAYNTVSGIADTCYQAVTYVGAYITEEANLVMDYMGALNLGEDV